MANDITSYGSITTNGDIVQLSSSEAVNSIATVHAQITGTWTGTVQFEASIDNATWVSIPGVPTNGGAAATSATANGHWLFNFAAYRWFRVRASAAMTGLAAVYLAGSEAGSGGAPEVAVGTAGVPSADVITVQGASGMTPIISVGSAVTCSTDITRPADTTTYAVDDALANSTSSPTTGGFTLTGASRISGGSGILTDVIVASSIPGTTSLMLQGELWIFDQAVTAINDNAAFDVSDSDIKNLVAVVPFTLAKAGASNCAVHVQNLNIGFTCSGSSNLRYLVKVKNAYVPASGEVITVRTKMIYSN